MVILAGSQVGSRAVDGSRQLLDALFKSEEDHVDWLEAQLDLIKQVGLQNYLATQVSVRT